MLDRFKFRYVFTKDFGGKTGICYKMPIFNLDTITDENFNKIVKSYIDNAYKLISIEQSTGLRDKNGKLIYEGDIVRNITGTYTFTGVIKFGKYTVSNSINQGFYVEWQKKYEDLFRNDLLYWLEKEEGLMIIGNIYENGDLLNE